MSDRYRAGPPPAVRIVGQALSRLVARFPSTWPLVRGPVRRFFDRVAPRWEQRIGAAGERMAPVEAALEALSEAPDRILDLGTGTGQAAAWLAERYPSARVTGIDIAEEMIRVAREKLPSELGARVTFAVADAAALPFADGELDLVVQVSVPAFFGETARVLAPGGHVAVVSSIGAATPFHTPHPLLRRGFERHRVHEVAAGGAGRGLYWLGRKSGSS